MKDKLIADMRRIIASYLRAAVALVGSTQFLDAFGARGWNGLLVSLLISLIPATLRAVETLASDIDPDD